MTIQRVNTFEYGMPLKRPYRSARGVVDEARNLLVRLYGDDTDHELCGVGETQLSIEEGVEVSWEAFQQFSGSLVGRTITTDSPIAARESIVHVLQDLRGIEWDPSDRLPSSGGPLIAIEMALLDIASQALGMSLSEFLGKRTDVALVTASTLSADNSPTQLRTKVQRRSRFPMLRSKGLAVVDKDLDLLVMLHDANESTGGAQPLWLDLDEGLDIDRAKTFVDRVATQMAAGKLPSLITIEQPLPADQRNELCALQSHADDTVTRKGAGEIRIMADESLRNVDDLAVLIGSLGCRAINVNPARVGGILASLDLASRAVEFAPSVSIGIGGYVGTSDITTFALVQLAKATPSLDYFTAVPPGNVQQRISRPLSKLEPSNAPVHREGSRPGIGTALDIAALSPYIRRQQWHSTTSLPNPSAGTTAGEPGSDGSIGHLAESAHRFVESRLELQSALQNHMDSARWAYDILYRRAATQEIVDDLGPTEIPPMAQRRMERYDISISNALSLRVKTAETAQANRLGTPDPAWKLADTAVATRFAHNLGLSRPDSDGNLRNFADIEEAYPCVIKSTHSGGALGSYLVLDRERIIHTQDGTVLSSWDEMAAHAHRLLDPASAFGAVFDEWAVEELVFDGDRPAHEVKFFAFYGEVPLALDVDREEASTHRFFDPNDNSRVSGSEPEQFGKTDVSSDELDLIRKISLSIPGPFVRIDMLRTENGLLLDGFSPRSVEFGGIDDVWDQKLGEAWASAERRLLDDLLEAREFSTFASSIKSPKSSCVDSATHSTVPSTDASGARDDQLVTHAAPTFSDIRGVLGGEWYGQYHPGTSISDATFRLRRVHEGSLIFLTDESWGEKRQKRSGQLLRTPLQVAERAAAKGAVLAISSTRLEESPIPVLVVKDTRRAMFKLAQWIRNRFSQPVVGITGTVGKSTTTSLLSSILHHDRRVHHTPGNWNTVDGVSDTLFGLIAQPDIAVVEAALSGFVVVPQFSSEKLVQPTITVITAIGEAHRNMAPTVRDTAKIKGKLVSGIRPGGSVVLNADTPHLDLLTDLAKSAGADRVLTFGRSAQADLRLINWDFDTSGMSVQVEVFGQPLSYTMSSAGEGLAMNSLSSFAAATLLGLGNDAILSGISAYEPIDHVSSLHEVNLPEGGKCLIIDDSTNATIMSMNAAFQLLARVKKSRGGRSIAALGKVNYLRDEAETLHATLAAPLKESGIEYVLTTGDGMDKLREELGDELCGPHAATPEHMVELIREVLRPNDILLLKGSNMGTGFRDVATSLLSGEQ
ncbi:MAG: Mur ligase family protein [Brevibacterium sp.]